MEKSKKLAELRDYKPTEIYHNNGDSYQQVTEKYHTIIIASITLNCWIMS